MLTSAKYGAVWLSRSMLCKDNPSADNLLSQPPMELARLLALAPMNIAMFDTDMRYLASSRQWNQAYLEGHPDPTGLSHYELLPTQPAHWKTYHQKGFRGEASNMDYDLWIDKHGQKNFMHWSITPWRDSRGKVGGILIITEDATAERLSFEALMDSRERYELAMQATNNGIYDWDVERDAWYWSMQFRCMLGLPDDCPASLNHWANLVSLKDQARVLTEFQTALSNKECEQFSFEYSIKHQEGHEIPLLTRGIIKRDTLGNPLRVVGANIDQSLYFQLRSEAEQSARQAAIELENKKSKSLFLATISHEIRNPLNGIKGVADLLAMSVESEELKELIHAQQSAIGQLTGLLNDVLDYSKIEAGKLEISSEPFDLNSVIEDLATLKRLSCRQKGIEFRLDKRFESTSIYLGDALRVRQIMQNLLSNALKFTQQGHIELVIDTRAIGANKDLITMTIADTGLGIKLEDQHRLFQPFVQSQSDSTKHIQGTGLGLSIVKSLAQQMGGDVALHSQLGLGSTFTVSLVLERYQDLLVINNEPEKLFTSQQTILLLNDDNLTRRAVAALLEKVGHSVVTVGDCKQALSTLKDKLFDVVMTDYSLPDSTGVEFMLEAKELLVDKFQPKFICLSGHTHQEFVDSLIAKGFDAYFPKPLDLKAFCLMLENDLRDP